MALENVREHTDNTAISKVVDRVLNAVSLQLSLLGVVFVISGFAVQFISIGWTNTGVWSAVLAIWGTALFLFGLLVYSVIWWSYQ